MSLRTLDEIRAAGHQAGLALPPMTQAQSNLVAALLAPYVNAQAAA